MDSLTQIVLGAAVGEAVAGKRIGNRAMVWGAIGGTIPDLDVLSNLWMREIDALAVHRGITHSLFFSIVAPLVFAWLVRALYRSGTHQSDIYKWLIGGLNIVFIALIVVGNYWITGSIPALLIIGSLGGYLIWRLHKYYIRKPAPEVSLSYWGWYFLFFMAFATHIALDCFTTYGTQVLQPFNNLRVAFNTISVVDPMYTIPFLTCLISAAVLRQGDKSRAFLNWLGIALSSLYLCVTIFNKKKVDTVLESTMEEERIEVQRSMTAPTIFNNILWNCLTETPEAFYWGNYSLYDSEKKISLLNRIDKDLTVNDRFERFDEYQTLKWFSSGYFVTREVDDGYQYIDLRFGAMTDSMPDLQDFVFRFSLLQHEARLEIDQIEERPDDIGEAFEAFIERLKGR